MIRQATIADLPHLKACADGFYAASKFLRRFDLERFVATWTALIESGTGAVFVLDDFAGCLGGVVYPEAYSGELIATEFFWWVNPEHRGGGIALYRAFEAWARERGCTQIRMVHLLDSMPEKLERVYRHFGFVPAEVHYSKELT